MLKFMQLLEDIATLNSQLNKYRDYIKSRSYVSNDISNYVSKMEQKLSFLNHRLQVMALAY